MESSQSETKTEEENVGTEFQKLDDDNKKKLMLLGTLGAIIHGALLPAFSLLFGEFADAFNLPLEEIIEKVEELSLYFIYSAIAAFFSSLIQQYCWSLAKERQMSTIKKLYIKSILKQEIGWFDQNTTGSLTTRISGDTSVMGEAMGEKVGSAVQFLSTFVFGFLLGFVKGWKLTLVLLATTPLLAGTAAFMSLLLDQLATKSQDAYANAGSIATEVISGIKTIASFNAESKETERYFKEINEAKKIGIKKGFIMGFGMGAPNAVLFGSFGLALWYGGQLVKDGELTGGAVLMVLFGVIISAFVLGQAGPSFEAISIGRGAAYVVYNTIDRESKIDPTSTKGKTIKHVEGNIRIKDVTFRYPTRQQQIILKKLNLKIKKGSTVALVGESGSGKSTVIQLLQRFYDPEKGSIHLDNTNLKDLNVNWLRSQIGLVSQEPVLFSGTIAENISWGAPHDNPPSLKQIKDAAKSANAHNFISEFPDGYNTKVGEKGAQLSGGQKQRIAIARAIIKNPKILLLDEATSALDSKSEKIVQDALDTVMEGRTTIIVAHRLSTIRNSDNIIVFKNGEVVEQGTHSDLIDLDSVYSQLVKLQGGEQKVQKKLKKKKKIQKQKISKLMNESKISASKKSTAHDEEESEYPKVSLGRLIKANKPELKYMAIALYGAFLFGLVNPGFTFCLVEILVLFYIPEEIDDEIPKWAILFAIFGVCSLVGTALESGNIGIAGQNLITRLRKNSFKAILRNPIGWFDEERHSSGILAARLASDTVLVEGLIGLRLSVAAQSFFTVVLSLGISFYYGWKLTLVIMALSPLIGFGQMLQFLTVTGLTKNKAQSGAEATQIAIEAIGNIRTVAAFTAEKVTEIKYAEKEIGPEKKAKKTALITGLMVGFGESMTYFTYAASFWYAGKLIGDGESEFSDAMMVLTIIIGAALTVGEAMALLPSAAKAKIAANNIFGLIDSIPSIDSLSNSGKKIKNLKGKVEFNSIDFVYPTRPKQLVLDNFSLEIEPGKVLALVGESGCGKSSTIGLIQRYYDSISGSLKFDDINIRDLNIKYLRSQIGFVGQEPVLFSGTISDNIKYGKPDATEKEIQNAAKSANAHKFIEKFPDGYNTKVGEKGAQLSGGQKQRIAIARAIIKNPKILLLDEATSALDTESEKIVQDALDKVMKGRTTIIVAHRLSTIRNSDKIAVIDCGNVCEQGTHDELIEKKGMYYSLVQRQVSN